MALIVRPMRRSEALQFLKIQRAAVRGSATAAYPAAIIEAWAPVPVTPEALERFFANTDRETRLIAEWGGAAVGIGALVVADHELLACYVVPGAARQGVGRAIVAEIERRARQAGLDHLDVTASLNAEAFYAALGYSADGPTDLEIAPGVRMRAVSMRKMLPPPLAAARLPADVP